MKKGFMSIVLVLTIISITDKQLQIYNNSLKGMEAIKNELILQQRINGRIYEIEHGFENAVRNGLNTMSFEALEGLSPIEKTKLKSATICSHILLWSAEQSLEFDAGYINVNNYDVFSIEILPLTKCANYIYVNDELSRAVVRDNHFIDLSSLNQYIGFVFKDSVYNAEFKVVIPQDTVIERW